MEIKRDAYLEQLKIRKDNGMIKIIMGMKYHFEAASGKMNRR